MMAIHPRHKKKGLAKMMVSQCEDLAKKAGCSAIKTSNLELAEEELPHKKFLNDWYTQKLGYQKDSEKDYKDYIKSLKIGKDAMKEQNVEE